MKKLLTTLFAISALFAKAQFPQGINYQSIIRNTSGVVLPSTAVTVEFKLYSSPTSSISTVLLYDETHAANTNSFGMVNLVIGKGTVVGGVVAFNNIPWIIGVEYEVWVNSSQVGTRQPFMSVPYAFNALTADWAPAPTVTYTGNVLSVGGNTVSIPTGTYVGGTGITITSNTITNNAPDQTVSLTALGSATVTGTYPNFSIETPTVSAAASPTITGAGAATVTSAGNSFTVDVAPPSPPVIVGSGATTVTSSGNTYTVNTPVPTAYTAGNGIDITGGVISNTAIAVTPTITGTGAATVTSAGNSFTVDVPSAISPTITGTGAATVTSAGNSFTVDVPSAITPTVTGTGVAVVTPTTGNSFNVDVAAPVMTYSPPTNVLTLNQGSAITTVTLNGTGSSTVNMAGQGLASVTPSSGSSFTVSVPNPTLSVGAGSLSISNGNSVALPVQTLSINSNSLSISGGNTVTLPANTVNGTGVGLATVNSSANNFTVSVPNPTLSIGSGSISISNGNSVALPASTSLTAGSANITLNQSGNNYTITPVTPNFVNSGPSTITGTYPNYTLTSTASPSTTLVQGNNITLNQSGNTYTVNGVTPSLSVAGNSITVTPGNTVALPSYTLSTSATSLTIANGNSVAWPTHSLSVSSNSLTINGPGGNTVVMPAPTLALSGSTLTSGVSTNSVNLATLPGLWSAPTSSTVVTTNSLSLVGIGTPTPGYKLDVYANGSVPATIHGYNSGATVSSTGVFGEHPGLGIGVFGQSVTGKGIWGSATTSGVGVYGESVSGDAGKFILSSNTNTANAVNAQTNGTGAALYAKSYNAVPLAAKFDGNLKVTGNSMLDSSLMMSAYSYTPGLSALSEGRIFFNGTRFMVSENNGPYKALFGNSPWMQGATTVTLTNINDRVGIGTNAPNGALEVAVTNSVTDGVQVNVTNAANGGNAAQIRHFGTGNAGYFEINNGGSNSAALIASTNGTGRVIDATQNGTGEAGHFFINNASNVNSAVWARTTGSGPVYTAEQFGTGRAVDFRIFGSTNSQSVIYAQTVGTGPAGYFEVSNTSSTNNAVVGATSGTGDAILGNHLGTSGSAGHFNIPGGSPNTSPALLATNIASGDAFNANAGPGSAIVASNSSSVSATIKVNQSGIGDAAVITATQGRAIYASSNSTGGYSTAEFANGGATNVIYAYKNTGSTVGSAGSFANNEPGNGSDAVQIFNVGAGAGISSSNTNASPTAYAGVFDGGITTKGKTTTSAAYAFRAFNSVSTSLLSVRNDAIVEIGANVGINILNPTNRLHVNSSYSNAAALIENITSVSTASVAHGVLAKASSTHSLAAAVYANNVGTGPSVYGIKAAAETGIAGRFELLNTSNTADAVFALSSGSGAAVHASTGSTAGSALALWVENGHVKSTQAALPSVATVSVSGGGVSSISYTMTAGSSDVKGSMLAVITTTGIVNAGNNAVIRVTFNKNYAVAPTVIITPTSDFGQLTYYVTNVTTSSFSLVIKNSTTSNLSTGTSVPVNFNYFVIE